MNRQKIYETVVEALLKQNAKSFGSNEILTCQYRGAEGRKCAIGHLIPDELYDPKMEGMSVPGILKYTKLREHLEIQNLNDIIFFSDLQIIHDSRPVSEWTTHLHKFGLQYQLEIPKVVTDRLR